MFLTREKSDPDLVYLHKKAYDLQTAAERSEAVLAGYKKAFSGFSDEEMSILDGVLLEPAARR